MTIEHCVLSAAYEREPTTCRDLCVKKHTHVTLTDPAGYTFPVATDSACRNRLLHSRPIDGAEFIAPLWKLGVRGFHLVFNIPGEPVGEITRNYRAVLNATVAGEIHRHGCHPSFTLGRVYTRTFCACGVTRVSCGVAMCRRRIRIVMRRAHEG